MGGGSFPPDFLSNLATRYHWRRQVISSRRFPPSWQAEETDACFIVRDANAQAAYVYFEEEPGRRSAAHLLTRDEARRIAANIAKLPELQRPG
jgi:hypothetical protein